MDNKYHEGNRIPIRLYLVVKRADGTCDREYDAVGKTATLTIVSPGGTTTHDVTVTASDDTSRAKSMVIYTIPAADTAGRRGRWVIVARVGDDELTFGPAEFTVVSNLSEVGPC